MKLGDVVERLSEVSRLLWRPPHTPRSADLLHGGDNHPPTMVAYMAMSVLTPCITGFAVAYTDVLSHQAAGLAALIYILVRLAAGQDAASRFVNICSWILPLMDLASNALHPPLVAKVEALLAVRELVFICSLCGALVLGAHGSVWNVARPVSIFGVSWAVVYLQLDDARLLVHFVPLVVVPSLLGCATIHFTRSSSIAPPALRSVPSALRPPQRTEVAIMQAAAAHHDDQSPEVLISHVVSDICAAVSSAPFQISALAVALLWTALIHRQRTAPLSWNSPPLPASVTWPLLATTYLATLWLYGSRAAANVWAAACIVATIVGLMGVMLMPVAALQVQALYMLYTCPTCAQGMPNARIVDALRMHIHSPYHIRCGGPGQL